MGSTSLLKKRRIVLTPARHRQALCRNVVEGALLGLVAPALLDLCLTITAMPGWQAPVQTLVVFHGVCHFVRLSLGFMECVLRVSIHIPMCRMWMCVLMCGVLPWHFSASEAVLLTLLVWSGFSDEDL